MTAGGAVPIADAPSLGRPARRTSLLVWAVVAAATAAGAVALVATPAARHGTAAAAATRSATMVVIDVSGSVTSDADHTVNEVVRGAAAAGSGGIGLVLFSDAAELALPPRTPPSEVLRFLRYYRAGPHAAYDTRIPWASTFSLGTRISSGLAAARRALERERLHGRVLLVSDLGDAPADMPTVRSEAVRMARDGIQLQIATLPGASTPMQSAFQSLVGRGAFVGDRPAAAASPGGGEGSWPLALVVAAVAVAALLAVVELAAPLRWGRT